MTTTLIYQPVKKTRAARERVLIRRPYRFAPEKPSTIGKFERTNHAGWVFRLNGQDQLTMEELAEILGVMAELP